MTRLVPSLVALTLALSASAQVSERSPADEVPEAMRGVIQDDLRGAKLDLDATFIDHNGERVQLSKYFSGDKPVLLTLNYYRCTMLCSEVLNGLVKGLRDLKWTPGVEFELVTISIDFRETDKLAAGKRTSYLDDLAKEDKGADWHFLTGSRDEILKVADGVGYHYKYDRHTDQYAHPPSIVFLSPDGTVSQYLFGKVYRPIDLRFALMDASEGKIGDAFDALAWTCYHLDETTGEYTPYAMGIMRVGGGMTVIGITLFIFYWLWRDRRQRARLVEQMT